MVVDISIRCAQLVGHNQVTTVYTVASYRNIGMKIG